MTNFGTFWHRLLPEPAGPWDLLEIREVLPANRL